MSIVVCFGEVLWDVFSGSKKIGGAPLNAALRLNSFGVNASIISSIGNDENGRELLDYMRRNNLDASTVQINDQYQTGCVNVKLDEKGSATYEIAYPVAWDKIEVNERSITLIKESDAFIFGSLACRDTISKKSLLAFLEYAKFKVFDVNLRPPFYSIDLLTELMLKADFIKLNDEELAELCTSLGFNSKSMEEQIKFLAKKTSTAKICITKGVDGAILFIDGKYYTNKGYTIKVVDTVGAGDSFLATLISKLLNNSKPSEALNFACAVGAMVAGSEGANPKFEESQIFNFLNNSLS